ncbi:hypothetical protein GCK72_019426 [Caenorhabditis remanei]|uniref:Uncharacterized protein n=1 Tax=Caenorhabditis remanei TaxID=31234 RepID=A0A6A5GDU5_CAERE|nr:hypothetical protein GCK72_019426 [Caenorhabditis remanei]KAF1752871.1 hypothetical protein GCK72_019426 [Caenorhabditis remanei]
MIPSTVTQEKKNDSSKSKSPSAPPSINLKYGKMEEDENGVSSTTRTTPRFVTSPMVSSLIAAKCEAEAVIKV